jgi:Fic family protein
MSSKQLVKEAILQAICEITQNGVTDISVGQLVGVKTSPATLKRHLEDLVDSGDLTRTGKARSTRYRLSTKHGSIDAISETKLASGKLTFPVSAKGLKLLALLEKPLAIRAPVTYQRRFIGQYIPNETFLLPKDVAESLYKEGRMRGQQPAGTYARKVLEQLLIDLSWYSSRLEGNRRTLLETEELFKQSEEAADVDAVMLLNHKRAIEFLVDAVPEYGITNSLVRNLHSLLMQDLLSESRALGEIRTKLVNISDTVYIPSQIPTLLGEVLNETIEKAKLIKNPIEASFFLWINIAYLQPFEDGNKRTSRLAANIPLFIYNCAPLAFLEVDTREYAYAMIGVYEFLDTSLAADLFAWTYRRSIQKYTVIMESLGAPDAFRLKHRELLSVAVQSIVLDGKTEKQVLSQIHLSEQEKSIFAGILKSEILSLTVNNCARHRINLAAVERWIKNARPS